MKIVVEVSGGVAEAVHNLGDDFLWTGEWEPLDWDDVEADPTETWKRMSVELKAFVEDEYPEEYKRYFASLPN